MHITDRALRIGLILSLALLVAGCAAPAPAVPPTPTPTPLPRGELDRQLESGGARRRYLLHIPVSYRPTQPAPLVIALHGWQSAPEAVAQQSGLPEKADAAGFLLALPAALGEPATWDPHAGSADVAFLRDLIVALEREWPVDPDRVYVTGFSLGGGMAHRAGCDLADLVTAIGPVSGAYLDADPCTPARPVSVLAFHGAADSAVPYAGSPGASDAFFRYPPVRDWIAGWAQRDACLPAPRELSRQAGVRREAFDACRGGSVVELITIDGWEHAWPAGDVGIDATDVLWEFFVAHPRPSSP